MELHVAISRLKLKFMSQPEALIHGDLHTGSIMVTERETRVIDPEFAFYGPMGFDVGAVIANLLMAYFASAGHERSPGERRAFEAWLLETIEKVWTEFARKFLELWRTDAARRCLSGAAVRGDQGAAQLEAERQAYMERLFTRHRRICRRQDHPPHPRPRPQHRFRVDRGPEAAGDLRGAQPAACARDADRRKVVPEYRCGDRRGAGVGRLAAGFSCGRGGSGGHWRFREACPIIYRTLRPREASLRRATARLSHRVPFILGRLALAGIHREARHLG